jgi:hypothetical protein
MKLLVDACAGQRLTRKNVPLKRWYKIVTLREDLREG